MTVLDLNKDAVVLPAHQIPSFRLSAAVQAEKENNILIFNSGGIGDLICAEPAIRFMLDQFKGPKYSLATWHPELFRHLKFEAVFDLASYEPRREDYYVLTTLPQPSELKAEFIGHMVVNCIDYPALSMLRGMIPNSYKMVQLYPAFEDFDRISEVVDKNWGYPKKPWVAVHPGKHWPSKTFPVDWWNDVLHHLKRRGLLPVLIGGQADENRTTVDVDPSGCADYRGKLSLMESVALLQSAYVVLTNDSAPLHMAASGQAQIGFFATVKHPDFITHWRGPRSEFGWKMTNLSFGGLWKTTRYLPNVREEIKVDQCDEDLMRSWLPKPEDVAEWARGYA